MDVRYLCFFFAGFLSFFVCFTCHVAWLKYCLHAVASLGLVSPGAATDGVTLFFLEKLTTFYSHRPLESDDLFSAVVSSPLPSTHLPSFIQCSFYKSSHKK